MSDDPRYAGIDGDGSKSLTRESVLGNLGNGALVALALYVANWLGELDMTPLPDWLEPLAVAGAGIAVGMLVSWVARNRKTGRAV